MTASMITTAPCIGATGTGDAVVDLPASPDVTIDSAAAPLSAPHGKAATFSLTPATGKSIGSVGSSFDATAYLNTWNSEAVNQMFHCAAAGTILPFVKSTYTDGSSKTVQRAGHARVT